MVQATRSGRQNIAEGSRAAATSSQTELRLVNVARSSLEELLLDYEDFLRQRRLKKWEPDAPEALAVRRIGQQHSTDQPERTERSDEQRYTLYAKWLDHDDPAIRANALLCLINQANYLLDNKSVRWRSSLSKMAATVSRFPLPASPNVTARSRVIRRTLFPLAQNAARPWSCAPPKKAKAPANNSGAARLP